MSPALRRVLAVNQIVKKKQLKDKTGLRYFWKLWYFVLCLWVVTAVGRIMEGGVVIDCWNMPPSTACDR